MRQVDREVDRYLTLLGDKVRGQGFTQLEVQEALGWGRSYISQLVTKQKSLRLDQVLLILGAIGVEPADFFAELYSPRHHLSRAAAPISQETAATLDRELPRLKAYLRAVSQQLVERGLISADDLAAAVDAVERRSGGR
jgi:transcriptional regulator with XRE-family HTH domain